MKSQQEIIRIVQEELASTNWLSEPIALYDPIAYTMSMGGKHIRSAITLMACNVYSENIQAAIKPAIGLEVFHNFTLLHDDIMDKADTRRGKPTVHVKWNDNAAILSGDAMLIKAYQLIAQCPKELLADVLAVFSQTAIEVCEGQQYDMNFENQDSVSEEEYLEMIRLKTAVLLAASLKIGAIIGGATAQQANALYDFGIHIGIAFQLQDDLLDVYGDPIVFGKKIGGDISCNKKTFLLIRALHNATPTQRKDLLHWIAQNPMDKTEKIAQVTTLYNETGVKQDCHELMQQHFERALICLKHSCEEKEKTVFLEKLAQELMQREK
jgi:geranylgeranyl diphosphate synthase, type II